MSRKTIDVSSTVSWANEILKNSDSTVEFRLGIRAMVFHILHSTGNYRGYRYIAKGTETVKDGWGYDYETKEFNDFTRLQFC